MDTRKLLVADASVSICASLGNVLGGAYELRVCHDGLEAQALLNSFQPDILVIDLALPGLDGLTVLKTAACAGCRPSVLVTACFVSPYIENAVRALNVDYLMVKPCDIHAMAERIHDLADGVAGTAVAPPSSGNTVANMLLALNVATKHGGFRRLEEAVILYEQNPDQLVTKHLYPEVAKRCGGNSRSVERAIRSAIHSAWARRDEKVWRLYFHAGRDGSVPRPTNTAFISTLAELLRRQNQEWAQM